MVARPLRFEDLDVIPFAKLHLVRNRVGEGTVTLPNDERNNAPGISLFTPR